MVKELRLWNISTVKAANAYLPLLMAGYNLRFGRSARSDFDTHRPVRDDEDLSVIFLGLSLGECRKRLALDTISVSTSLTISRRRECPLVFSISCPRLIKELSSRTND